MTGALTTRDVLTVDELAQSVTATVSLAAVFDRELARLGPASVVSARLEAYGAFARSQGLDLSPSPLRLRGTVPGGALRIYARAAGEQLVASVTLTFEPALPTRLLVRDRRWIGLKPGPEPAAARGLRTGDASFDRAFATSAENDTAALARLSDQVRTGLVALLGPIGDGTLDEQSLSFTTQSLPEPDALRALVEQLLSLERALRSPRAQDGGDR